MSTFSDIHQKILTVIPTLTGFSDKTQIPRPESLEDNSSNLIRNGWGVAIDTSELSSDSKLPISVITQSFTVILTSEVVANNNDPSPRVTEINSLMDDRKVLVEEFINGTTFGISDKIEKIDIVAMSGVEDVNAGKNNYINISVTFSFLHWL